MKIRRTASPFAGHEAGRSGPPIGGVDDDPQPRLRHLGLSPMVAITIATAGLALGFGLETDRFGFRLRNLPECSPAEAVDISLQRLMRLCVSQRLQRERRLNASPYANRATIDDELGRIREHPLYVMIKERMTDHLRNEGYERVALHRTEDPNIIMLSLDAEAALSMFIHSLRASVPTPNEKIVTFLKDQEEICGKSIVARRGADRYDVYFPFLIQLLGEYPDGLEPIAKAVEFVPRPSEEIERGVRREGPD
jgi:hypothetical protein